MLFRSIVYHGIYSYAPNLEAVRLIARELLPRLRAHGMHAAVVAIGPHAPRQTVDEDVVFTGSVDNLAPYLKSADLAVVPLQKGGGTRMKILEYFAAGVPVVATSKAVEGIPLRNGVHARIEDDFDAMGAAVMQLLADAEGRSRLVENARDLVKDLDWRVIVRRYLDLVGWDDEVDHPRAAAAH